MEHGADLKGKNLFFLLFLWILWFGNYTVRMVFSPILPLLEDEFLVKHAKASSLFLFLAVGYALSMFLSGIYSGRLGHKKSILCSLLTTSLVFFLIPFVKTFALLYASAFIFGVALGFYLPSAIPLITERFAERHWGKCIAIHDSAASIGIFSLPFIALFLLTFLSWRGMFVVLAGGFLVAAICFYFMTDELKIRSHERGAFGGLVGDPSLWLIGTVFACAAGANLGVYSVVPLYLTKELSLGIGYANSVLGVSRIGSLAVALSAGLFVDRVNLKKTMFGFSLATGLFTVALGLAPGRYVGTLLFFQAAAATGVFPLSLVALARKFNREQRSMATSLVMVSGIVFGGGAAPYLLGLSGDLVSFEFGIVALGLLVILLSPLILAMGKVSGQVTTVP
jgi:MFS transporter, NNP family, nitrate/nitrite transporter